MHSHHSPRLIENSGWLLGLRRKLKLCRTYHATTRNYGCKPAKLFDLCAPVSNAQCALLLVALNQLLLKVSYFTNPLIPWQLPNRHHFEGQVLTMEFLQMLGNWFNILHNSAESRDYLVASQPNCGTFWGPAMVLLSCKSKSFQFCFFRCSWLGSCLRTKAWCPLCFRD